MLNESRLFKTEGNESELQTVASNGLYRTIDEVKKTL